MRDTSLWVVEAYLESSWGKELVERWGVTPELVGQEGLKVLKPEVQWALSILCVFLTIFFLYVVGVVTANIFGRRLVLGVEGLVDRIPFVKTVYRASKQILETFTGESAQNFQRVALIPFPTPEIRSIGFITSIFKDSKTGEELVTTFIASTPNPTTGWVFVLRRSEVIELDWSIEDAVKAVMSGGAIMPPTVPLSSGAANRPPAIPVVRQPAQPVRT